MNRASCQSQILERQRQAVSTRGWGDCRRFDIEGVEVVGREGNCACLTGPAPSVLDSRHLPQALNFDIDQTQSQFTIYEND